MTVRHIVLTLGTDSPPSVSPALMASALRALGRGIELIDFVPLAQGDSLVAPKRNADGVGRAFLGRVVGLYAASNVCAPWAWGGSSHIAPCRGFAPSMTRRAGGSSRRVFGRRSVQRVPWLSSSLIRA